MNQATTSLTEDEILGRCAQELKDRLIGASDRHYTKLEGVYAAFDAKSRTSPIERPTANEIARLAVNQIQYVVVGARDLDAWTKFGSEGIGLVLHERTDDTLYFRCDRAVSRLIVRLSEIEDIQAVGWNVRNEIELEAMIARLEAMKIDFEELPADEAKARKAMRVLRLRDPDEIVQEVAWGIEVCDSTPGHAPFVRDGFRAWELGLGHVVLSISDLAASKRFYREVLGLETTAHFFIQGFEAVFLRCNERHHALALSMSGRPTRLQHIQFEYHSFDDLGRAMDRAEDLPMEVVATLGKHASDWVTSFYVRAPSGLVVELGYGARTLAPNAPTEFENFTGSIWGHRKGMENA